MTLAIISSLSSLKTFVANNISLLPTGFFSAKRNRIKTPTLTRRCKSDGSIMVTDKRGGQVATIIIGSGIAHYFWSEEIEVSCHSHFGSGSGSVVPVDKAGKPVDMSEVATVDGDDNGFLAWSVTHVILIPKTVVEIRHSYSPGGSKVVKL